MKCWELLATPDKWTQRFFAKDIDGDAVMANERGAICWCLDGAIQRCYGSGDKTAITSKIKEKLPDLPNGDSRDKLLVWNDAPERTHAEVLALCRELDI